MSEIPLEGLARRAGLSGGGTALKAPCGEGRARAKAGVPSTGRVGVAPIDDRADRSAAAVARLGRDTSISIARQEHGAT